MVAPKHIMQIALTNIYDTHLRGVTVVVATWHVGEGHDSSAVTQSFQWNFWVLTPRSEP